MIRLKQNKDNRLKFFQACGKMDVLSSYFFIYFETTEFKELFLYYVVGYHLKFMEKISQL